MSEQVDPVPRAELLPLLIRINQARAEGRFGDSDDEARIEAAFGASRRLASMGAWPPTVPTTTSSPTWKASGDPDYLRILAAVRLGDGIQTVANLYAIRP